MNNMNQTDDSYAELTCGAAIKLTQIIAAQSSSKDGKIVLCDMVLIWLYAPEF